jgi:penicillin-binding protein 1A
MGITKDLVTGVWVGCDERTAHFKNGETGEGSRTALPIFAKFMEKVYKDPSTGYTMGPFPKSKVKITVDINCPTPRYEVDTATTDSLAVDSTEFNVPVTDEQQQGANQEEQQIKTEESKTPDATKAPAKQPATEAPLTKKEERQLKRKQRQEEKEKKKNDQ